MSFYNTLNPKKVHKEDDWMQDYELIVIIKDKNDGIAESVKKIKDLLGSKNIKINKEDEWGLKTLAYPIKNETSGHYIIYNINSDPQNIKPLENTLRINEDLLRFRIFKFEKKTDKKIKSRRKK